MTFTTKIDLSLTQKLESDLIERGFTISKPPYTLFCAKKKGITCTLYESGSLTVQGKEMKEFIEFYLEPEILKNFTYSNPELHINFEPRIGMDEAGKGDFFGPLCVAAIFADEAGIRKMIKLGLKDSKRLSDQKITQIAKELKSQFSYTVIRLFPEKYNELHTKFTNLNRLLAWAHVTALKNLSEKTHCKKAILDQFAAKHVAENFLKQKKLDIELEQRTKGEEDLVVAAASILARDAFLDGIRLLEEQYGVQLMKGASLQVVALAQKLVAKFGPEVLQKLAKTHFKTMDAI